MPIPRQPTQIGGEDRIQHTDTPIAPTHRRAHQFRAGEQLRISIINAVIGTNVHNQHRPISPADEEIRDMMMAVGPVNPKRLRGNTNDVRIGIESHHMIAFKPRLITYVVATPREPPRAGKIALPTKGWKPTNRINISIEVDRAGQLQRQPGALTVNGKLQYSTAERTDTGRTSHDLPANLQDVSDQMKKARRCIKSNENASLRMGTDNGAALPHRGLPVLRPA